MSYDSSNDKQTVLTEVGRISGRLKIALQMYIAGRDQMCAEMVLEEILKLDELEMFLESILCKEMENMANAKPDTSRIQ